MKTFLGGGVIAALLLVAGCGSGASVTPNARYGSLDELKAAATAAGFKCDDWQEVSEDGESEKIGRCGKEAMLRVAPTSEVNVAGAVMGALFQGVEGDGTAALLVGPNWTISGSTGTVEPLEKKMGGQLVDPATVDVDALLADLAGK